MWRLLHRLLAKQQNIGRGEGGEKGVRQEVRSHVHSDDVCRMCTYTDPMSSISSTIDCNCYFRPSSIRTTTQDDIHPTDTF